MKPAATHVAPSITERGRAIDVSVVIPCRNVRAHVPEAVASALGQEGVTLEVIAIDDGSTDGTSEALNRLRERDVGRMRVVELGGEGACAARNAGLLMSAGEFVQFLDADDVLRPGKIQRQLGLARASGADVVAGGYVNCYENGRPDEVVMPLQGDPWQALIRTRMGTTSANLFRREAVMAAGAWDAGLRSSQDYELLFRMLQHSARIAWDMVPGCDVLKRERGSISRTDERENWLRYMELRARMRDHVQAMDTVAGRDATAAADQYLFMAIRVLSAHDRNAAFLAHDRLLQAGFRPNRGAATSGAYVRAYNWLGFRWAERLWRIKEALMGR